MKKALLINQGFLWQTSPNGFVLVTVMLFLTVLSMSAFVAVEQSQFSYKVNSARIAKIKARAASEQARLTSLSRLEKLLESEEINTIKIEPLSSTEKYNMTGLRLLLTRNEQDARAEVYVKELPIQIINNGVSLSQHSGYLGLGSGMGSFGSFARHFEVLSKGLVNEKGRDLSVWTASDYRYVPD